MTNTLWAIVDANKNVVSIEKDTDTLSYFTRLNTGRLAIFSSERQAQVSMANTTTDGSIFKQSESSWELISHRKELSIVQLTVSF